MITCLELRQIYAIWLACMVWSFKTCLHSGSVAIWDFVFRSVLFLLKDLPSCFINVVYSMTIKVYDHKSSTNYFNDVNVSSSISLFFVVAVQCFKLFSGRQQKYPTSTFVWHYQIFSSQHIQYMIQIQQYQISALSFSSCLL